MYIGKQPTIGNFQVCDAISTVNGQATYNLTVNSVAVTPETANHVLCSVNGILQKPGSSFTIVNSTIVFSANLVTGDVVDFVHILGSVLDLGVPSDDTVTAAKLGANAVTGAKLNTDVISAQTALATEPADTDEFLVSDAGVLKRIDYSLIKGGGGLIHIKTQNITSGVSSVDFNHGSSDVVFDSTYNAYKLIVSDMRIATDNQKLHIRYSTDAGSSYLTSNYDFSGMTRDSNSGTDNFNSASDSDIRIHQTGQGNAAAESMGLEINIYKPSTTDTRKLVHGTIVGISQHARTLSGYFSGSNTSTAAITGFQIRSGSGNIDRGNFTLFGVANS